MAINLGGGLGGALGGALPRKRAPKPAPLPKVGGPLQPAPGAGRKAVAPPTGRAKAATMGKGKKTGLRKMGY